MRIQVKMLPTRSKPSNRVWYLPIERLDVISIAK